MLGRLPRGRGSSSRGGAGPRAASTDKGPPPWRVRSMTVGRGPDGGPRPPRRCARLHDGSAVGSARDILNGGRPKRLMFEREKTARSAGQGHPPREPFRSTGGARRSVRSTPTDRRTGADTRGRPFKHQCRRYGRVGAGRAPTGPDKNSSCCTRGKADGMPLMNPLRQHQPATKPETTDGRQSSGAEGGQADTVGMRSSVVGTTFPPRRAAGNGRIGGTGSRPGLDGQMPDRRADATAATVAPLVGLYFPHHT